MKVLGIIPARFASSRFPGKPLIDLKGKSMIQRVYEGALKSTKITDVIVATDDQRIVDAVLAFGGKVQLYEIAKLAQTIPYEMMTNISERVKRVYIRE